MTKTEKIAGVIADRLDASESAFSHLDREQLDRLISRMMGDPSLSYAFKNALAAALHRDIVDAAREPCNCLAATPTSFHFPGCPRQEERQ